MPCTPNLRQSAAVLLGNMEAEVMVHMSVRRRGKLERHTVQCWNWGILHRSQLGVIGSPAQVSWMGSPNVHTRSTRRVRLSSFSLLFSSLLFCSASIFDRKFMLLTCDSASYKNQQVCTPANVWPPSCYDTWQLWPKLTIQMRQRSHSNWFYCALHVH